MPDKRNWPPPHPHPQPVQPEVFCFFSTEKKTLRCLSSLPEKIVLQINILPENFHASYDADTLILVDFPARKAENFCRYFHLIWKKHQSRAFLAEHSE
jgi:hypothetical protein